MNFEHLRLLTQISIGFMLFWIVAGWSLIGEALAPENQEIPPAKPSSNPEVWRTRDSAGRGFHVLGQGFAILGLCTLSLLCARILYPVLQRHELSFTWVALPWSTLSLAALIVILLVESISVFMGLPLPPHRVSLDRFSFAVGRDQILRHGTALFLGLTLLIADLGIHTSARLALGVCLGWSSSMILWERRAPLSLQSSLRTPVGAAGVAMVILLSVRLIRLSMP